MSVFIKAGAGPAGPAGPAGATGPGGPAGIGGLVNGYMSNASLGGIGGASVGVEGGSTADGWLAASDGGYTYERVVNSGFPSQHYLELAKTVAPGKMLLVQYLNSDDSGALQQQDVTLEIAVQFFGGPVPPFDFRFGIFSSSNGVDNIARPLVTAWNGAGVDPTWDASVTLLAGITGSWGGGFSVGAIAVNAGFSNDNLGFGVWTNDVLAVGEKMALTACAINRGAAAFDAQKPQKSLNDTSCAGLIEKSYELDTAPGALTDLGALAFVGGQGSGIRFRTPKLFIPSAGPGSNPENGFTFYSPVTGAAGMMRDVTAVADVAAPALGSPSREGALFTVPGGAGNVIQAHFLANAHL